MPKDGSSTREKILEAAQRLIFQRGFAGVSIDSIIEQVGITKGAFFYHFKTKNDLAHALIGRFAQIDQEIFEEFTARSEKLSRDPLQQLLIYIGLFEEMFDDMSELYPGCLFASYVYELQQFDDKTQEFIKTSFLRWRAEMLAQLEKITEEYPPKIEVDLPALADTFTCTLEGGFIIAKGVGDPKAIPQQLRQFKNYIELLFSK